MFDLSLMAKQKKKNISCQKNCALFPYIYFFPFKYVQINPHFNC